MVGDQEVPHRSRCDPRDCRHCCYWNHDLSKSTGKQQKEILLSAIFLLIIPPTRTQMLYQYQRLVAFYYLFAVIVLFTFSCQCTQRLNHK